MKSVNRWKAKEFAGIKEFERIKKTIFSWKSSTLLLLLMGWGLIDGFGKKLEHLPIKINR